MKLRVKTKKLNVARQSYDPLSNFKKMLE